GTVYTATITITPKTGYTTTGVAANFFTVAGATSVTNAVNSSVVTAIFPATAAAASHNDGGSGGYSPPPVTPPAAPVTITETPPTGNMTPSVTSTTTTEAKSDSNGNAAAAVTESQITDAVNKAVTAAAQKGNDTAAKVEIKVTAPANAKSVETSIPKASFNAVADSKIDSLTVSTPIASITFDDKSLDTISKEAAGDVKITASKVDTSTLSEGTKQVVGDRPVFNFSVTCGDKTISQFGGNVEVSVPYTPKAGEDTSVIVIYYINAEGKLEIVSNCAYDPATGTIRFKTSHFSQYAVGYNKVSFKDVAVTAWYNNAVSFIAARGITTGTGNGNYSPEAKLTRGEFLVMMMRAYGIEADANPRDNFKDAGSTYYTGYLAAAKRLSITNGEGNNLFAPDKEITRQDMFTLLYNALKVIDKLPEGTAGRDLSSFSDSGEISSWAKDAMTLFIKTGTVTGSSGKLSPTSKTTRAEMAQVLFTLLSK
ncbi:MAG TPA: S-layer homology domain-containing protein, partial [Anaerovoracaceae bacterium]|nr:S-layer homology domain-containing protein [Anaerovoracaceae bacterium]